MKNELFKMTYENHVEFLLEGEEYYDTYIDAIDRAKHFIHLQTYIFQLDDFGKKVFDSLIRAARRGVKIFILIDSVGSRLLKKSDENKLVNAGVHFNRFNGIGLKWLYRWGRRLHHKVLLADGVVSIIGGINITMPTSSLNNSPQLDFAIIIRGPLVEKILNYIDNLFITHYPHLISAPTFHQKSHFPHGVKAKMLVNDWVHRRMHISRQYQLLTQNAKQDILIFSSYFFPRKKFMNQLVEARKRGVRIRLILPKLSDWPSYILATEYLYDFFLKNDIEIYLWNRSILHGKLALIDSEIMTIGSFNLNYTSYQQNLEMNVNLYSKTFCHTVQEQLERLIDEGCTQLNAYDFIKFCPTVKKIKRFFYYLLLSLIANFSVGLVFQEENNRENRFFSLLRVITSLVLLFIGLLGIILPIFPGVPFLILSFLIIYKQILFNHQKEY